MNIGRIKEGYMRLIDADELLKKYEGVFAYKMLKEIIENAPKIEIERNELLELIEWLKGEKYLIDEHSTTMTAEFEREHKYELSRNIMINKTIKKIEEMIIGEVD
jgi:hypothetical protein